MKQILFSLTSIVLFLAGCVPEDKPLNKDQASNSIDELYQQFTHSYETLDVDLVSSLYVEDAHYLPGDPTQMTMTNRDSIRSSFAGYFAWAEENNRDLTISFRIIERNIDDSLAYDVGYYLIRSKTQDQQAFPEEGGVGKFVTAMGLQPSGEWKFLLDGFSPAPYHAFSSDSTAHDPSQ